MVILMRRLLGLSLLTCLGAGCYEATFSDYEGRDAGRADTKPDSRKASRASTLEPATVPGIASPASTVGNQQLARQTR